MATADSFVIEIQRVQLCRLDSIRFVFFYRIIRFQHKKIPSDRMSSDTAKLALEAGQNATVDAKGRDIVSVVVVL